MMANDARRGSSRRLGARIAIVVTGVVSALTLAIAAFANVPLTTVSTDPYTNPSSYHQTEVEPDTFAWGSTIVAVFQTGRFADGGSNNTGFATSTNWGATWTHGFMPGTTIYADPPGPYARISDPSIAYDAKHDVWLANSLIVDTKNVDVVNRSTDGGLTWTNPVIISAPTGSHDYDKTWIGCDNFSQSPHFGNCYAEVDDYPLGDIVKMFTSTNGGKKWTEAAVATSHGLGGQPVAGPDGTVVVPFWADAGQIQSIVSNDGGVTFGGPYTVAPQQDHPVPFIRTEPLPTAEVDKNGKVYVAWQDCSFRKNCATNDIVYSTSKDGQSWSALKRIPIDPRNSTVDHYIPGLGVDPTTGGTHAHLALTYYYYPTDVCTSDTCRIYAGYVSSTNSGKTWSAPTQILGPLKLAWLPNAGGRFLGDYVSTSILGDLAFPVIANAKKGTCTLGQITSCKEFMVAPKDGLPVAGGAIAAGPERPIPGVRSDHAPRGAHTAH
jgi:hypothetical protein